MKVAILLTDNREEFHEYDKASPFFGPAPTALLEGLAGQPDLELHVLSCTKRPMSAPEKLAENIWFHLLPVNQWGWLRSLYSGCMLAIRSKLREIHPHLVHGQGTERYCAIAAVFSGFPNVITIHGNMRSLARISSAKVFSYQWAAAKLEKFTIPRAGGVVCLSSYTRTLTCNIARRTWLIPNAVTSDFFRTRVTASNPQDVLCVGTICRHKNQNALIHAFDHLASRWTFRLVFLGEGCSSDPYFQGFLQLIKARPWCVHEGFVNSERLKEFFGNAIAIALPSLEDNCPMVILEAAAAGVPIIASNVGGIPSLVQDGHTGLLFDPHDRDSIVSTAERCLSDSLFAKRMAANARAVAESMYHPARVARQHIDVYNQFLKN